MYVFVYLFFIAWDSMQLVFQHATASCRFGWIAWTIQLDIVPCNAVNIWANIKKALAHTQTNKQSAWSEVRQRNYRYIKKFYKQWHRRWFKFTISHWISFVRHAPLRWLTYNPNYYLILPLLATSYMKLKQQQTQTNNLQLLQIKMIERTLEHDISNVVCNYLLIKSLNKKTELKLIILNHSSNWMVISSCHEQFSHSFESTIIQFSTIAF